MPHAKTELLLIFVVCQNPPIFDSSSGPSTSDPQPLPPFLLAQPFLPCLIYRPFPMNFLFAKLNHHLLGPAGLTPPLPSSNNLTSNRIANSCLTCPRYALNTSLSFRSRAPSNAWFNGNPGSPGRLNCSSAILMSCFSALFASVPGFNFERQSLRKRMP